MSNPEPKFGYAFGTFATIMVLILDFLVILSSVSNCIVYNKIVSGEPNSDISVGWGRFMLGVNIIVAIFAFIIFFWILYILFTGKKSIGAELEKKRKLGGIGNYIYDRSKDIKNRLAKNYTDQGMSKTDADASATAVTNAAAAGNPTAVAIVRNIVNTTTSLDSSASSEFIKLKNWVESQGKSGDTWDSFISAALGDCSNPFTQGCSGDLRCSNGSSSLPCNPPGSPNDTAINEFYKQYLIQR